MSKQLKIKRQRETVEKLREQDDDGISIRHTTSEGRKNIEMIREKFINTPVVAVFFIEHRRPYYSSELSWLESTKDDIPIHDAVHCFQNIDGDVLCIDISSWDDVPEEFYHLGRENLTKSNMYGWSSSDMPNSGQLDFSKKIQEVYKVRTLDSLKALMS